MIHGRQPGRGALLGVQVVLLAALGGLPAAPPRAQPPGGAQGLAPEELQAGLRAAEREMVAGLEALVPWCTEQRLFARREALCEEILALAPDSAVAHEGLLHARDKDGIWQPPKKKSPAKDYTRSQVPVFAERRAAVCSAFVDAVLVLTAPPPAAQPTGPGKPAAAPRRVRPVPVDEAAREALARALLLAPDHPDLRARFGEARSGETWVLTETLRARERRGELKALVAAALEAVPAPEPTEPNEKELATGVAWQVTLATPWVRVMSTGSADEALRLARGAHAAIAVFREVFGTETELGPGFTIYVLTSDPERVQFVSGWPSWGPEWVGRTRDFVGAGVPMSQHTARWDPDPVNRLDGAIRHTLGELFRSEFSLYLRNAWAWEGLGIYLTRALVGTRRTWYGSLESFDPEAKKLVARLVTVDDVDWIDEAYQLRLAGQGPTLKELLARPIDKMGVHDMLLVYALAAYLLEGHPEQVTELLRETLDTGSAAEAFELVLGRPLAELELRFVRWLGEGR